MKEGTKMIKIMNDCNGCEDCINCGANRDYEAYACDMCEETSEHLYFWGNEIYCADCLKMLPEYKDEAIENYLYMKDSGIDEVSQ
jgi:hypothetical protein